MWPKKFFWQYKTVPIHLFDFPIRFLLRPVMLLFAHGKISHWWHWKKRSGLHNMHGVLVKGNPLMFHRSQNKISHIRMSLGGWKNVYVITPKEQIEKWQIGFSGDGKTLEQCTLILEGPIRFLQGPDNYRIFGFDLGGREIPLEATGPFPRSDNSIPWPIV